MLVIHLINITFFFLFRNKSLFDKGEKKRMAEKHARMRKKPHAGLHRFFAATERKYTAEKKSYTFGPTKLPDPDAKVKSDGEKKT